MLKQVKKQKITFSHKEKSWNVKQLQGVLVSHNSELQKIKFGMLIPTSGKAKRQANCSISILILLLAVMILWQITVTVYF